MGLVPSETAPHPSLAHSSKRTLAALQQAMASDTLSRHREKEDAWRRPGGAERARLREINAAGLEQAQIGTIRAGAMALRLE